MTLTLIIAIYIVCGFYMLANFKHDIQMLQQNSYRPERYWRWLKQDLFPAWRLIDVALVVLLFSTLLPPLLSAFIIALVAIAKTAIIFTKKHKKPLVFTKRVWRIYSLTSLLATVIYVAVIFISPGWSEQVGGLTPPIAYSLGSLLLITIFSWAFVLAAIYLLKPVEASINRKYYNDAKARLGSMPHLKVVGITGSYGKTSTKHYLERILSEQYDVLMTPGSYNTTMGVIRTVREMLKPYHQIFICEMGAKQKGDVKEICDLVCPQMGIVTAVGPMHLETFRNIENVQSTKFELVDALPTDGLAVVNDDFEYCANRRVENVECIRYAVENTQYADLFATNIVYSPEGTSFTVENRDKSVQMELRTKLVGAFNISNLLGAIAIALRLNMDQRKIANAVAHIEQVEHRLQVRRNPGGLTVIDDAFNSNPTGSRMAVEVLSHFKNGKRIIVTPGMIELGSRQYELNKELGHHIAKGVDVAIVVAKINREAIVEGIKEAGFEGKLLTADSFAHAQQLLASFVKPGDTVLYENDLPDSME